MASSIRGGDSTSRRWWGDRYERSGIILSITHSGMVISSSASWASSWATNEGSGVATIVRTPKSCVVRTTSAKSRSPAIRTAVLKTDRPARRTISSAIRVSTPFWVRSGRNVPASIELADQVVGIDVNAARGVGEGKLYRSLQLGGMLSDVAEPELYSRGIGDRIEESPLVLIRRMLGVISAVVPVGAQESPCNPERRRGSQPVYDFRGL